MKKRILSITIIIAMLLSASIIALAATTDGEIKFKDGDVIILPPGKDCCHCLGDDPCPGGCSDPNDPHEPGKPCECPCHDASPAYKSFAVENNLYFGEWTIGRGGQFNSANNGHNGTTLDTTSAGKYTGVQVINQKSTMATIYVTVDEFKFPNNAPLAGAELDLFARTPNAANGSAPGLVTSTTFGSAAQIATQPFVPGESQQILTAQPGTAVKAAWFGILDVPAGSGNQATTAQALMTWTDAALTP